MMAIAAAFFIVLAAALMWSCFAWFKTLINGMIETQKKSMQDLLAETRAQNAALELYALECYNVTAAHKADIEALTTVEEVVAYDYESDYPEKLNF